MFYSEQYSDQVGYIIDNGSCIAKFVLEKNGVPHSSYFTLTPTESHCERIMDTIGCFCNFGKISFLDKKSFFYQFNKKSFQMVATKFRANISGICSHKHQNLTLILTTNSNLNILTPIQTFISIEIKIFITFYFVINTISQYFCS